MQPQPPVQASAAPSQAAAAPRQEPAAPSPVVPAGQAVDADQVERLRPDAAAKGAPAAARSACWLPTRGVVVDVDGRSRGCQWARTALTGADGDALQAWAGDGFVAVRAALAQFTLPRAHCGACADRAADDLLEASPLVREAVAAPAPTAPPRPDLLVLRLPANGPLVPAVAAALPGLLPGLSELVLRAEQPHGEAFAAVLAAVAASDPPPALALRVDRIGDVAAATAALAGVRVQRLELLARDRDAEIAEAKALAQALGAQSAARFVLAPDQWFDFEEVARACASAGVQLALRLLGDDGDEPLGRLPDDALRFVKDVVGSAWSRCGGDTRPRSLAAGALDQLTAELRALLERRLQQIGGEPVDAAVLALPPVDHPWATDRARRAWWFDGLLGHGHTPFVRAWLAQAAARDDAVAVVREHGWLRALYQRVAQETQLPELLDLLRRVYSDVPPNVDLPAADARFAREFPLQKFGGPWAERLGVARRQPRQRPFALGPALPAPAADAPPADVTVLIPSYRHGEFIEETLRSVLAQRHGGFRVLVVDDCSPDDTVARARSVQDERIEVRVNQHNLGLGNSVLHALAHVTTPYVALLNSDDLFHPDRLARCCEVLATNADVQLVTTNLALVDQTGGELTPADASLVMDGRLVYDWVQWYSRVTPRADLPHDELFASLLEHNFLATSSNLVCRTDWLRAQAASLRSLKYCLDWQLFLEAALAGALHHLHEPLVAYRLHATNTVWFLEGRRWSYYLEVNRVAAAAVRSFAQRAGDRGEAEIVRILDAVAGHLTKNREIDGFALFANTLLDSLRLDRLAAKSPAIQELVQRLNGLAEHTRAALDRASAAYNAEAVEHTRRRLLLGELAAEQARIDGDRRRWLQSYVASLEQRLDECWAGRNRIEADKAERERDVQTLTARLGEEQQRGAQQAARLGELQADLAGARSDLAGLRTTLAVADDLQRVLDAELNVARGERDRLRGDVDALRGEVDAARGELAAAQQGNDVLQGQLADARAAAAAASAERARLDEARRTAELARDELVHELARARADTEQIARSREYRSGNFLWNKMPLAYLSRRGKKWYRRMVDAKNRCLMMLRRPRREQGVAVVAACWQWPIYSHTFVYQEMLGLTHMGLEVRMFHWDLGDTQQLHKAFAYLAEHRTQLQPIWENHARDKEHFERTKPGRLRAFLELVGARTGRSVEELEKEPLVVQGCTFARMAELAGARYLHSYFFYDQSFMVMQAAWLLGVPRGVSCYADHMLDDYPFKLVDLHVELADVVVATSARIKRELSAKSKGRFDDKIIVKPNGVDGQRFPALQRAPRAAGETFEVVSISRIEPKKGLTHLVEAIALCKQRGRRVIAHVIGSKDPHSKGSLEYAAEFERRIQELGVAGEIVLHGMKRQEELPPILQRCRAFVAPYVEMGSGDKDGIPTAMLEGLASGLPVVTTDSGSILEVVDDGVEGLIVPQRDSTAFADALQRLIDDPALERRMAAAARARFDREFDIRVTERRLHERVAAAIGAARSR